MHIILIMCKIEKFIYEKILKILHKTCKMSRKLPTIIDEKEFNLLINRVKELEKQATTNNQKKRYKQYRIAIILGFGSGMRISEIIGLKELYSRCCKSQVVSEKRFVGEKKKKIYLCSKCKSKLILSQNTYRPLKGEWEIEPLKPENISKENIIIKGGKGDKDRITSKPNLLTPGLIKHLPLNIKRRSLQHFFKKLSQEVLNKNLHFHSLRHSFGSVLAGKGVPLNHIQMLLGHSRLETTGIYLHTNPQQAIEGAKRAINI